MSRSRKKIPAYSTTCKWGRALKKSSKRAERRAVKNALHSGEWEIIPKPGEVGPKWICCCHKNGIHDPNYFSYAAKNNQKIYEEANKRCMYVFEIIDQKPYDYSREWLNDDNLDLMNYTSIYREIESWFPIYNHHPVDPRWNDETYIKNLYKRK